MYCKIAISSLMILLNWLKIAKAECNETLPCTTSDGQTGMCFNGQCSMISVQRQNLRFIIRAKYPELNIQGSEKQLYLKGSGLGLKDKGGILMNKTSTDTWEINVKYKSAVDGFRCQQCTDNQPINGKLQYRIFTANGTNMKGGNFAVDLPVSMTSSYFNTRPVFVVYPWFYSQRGESKNFTINSTEIGKTRTLYYYLPPSFAENTYKKYPNILAFDFYPSPLTTLRANGLDKLFSESGTMKEVVVIGYGDYQPASERFDLLTPTPGSGYLTCRNGTLEDLCDGCLPSVLTEDFNRLMAEKCGKLTQYTGKGVKLIDSFIKEFRPKVVELTQNRLLTDQQNTGVIGYSLGGLMSCHVAWTRSNVFGLAACQSPSFWWPRINGTGECAFDFINVTMNVSKFNTDRYPQKILVDAGSEESVDPYRLTQSVVDVALKMNEHKNFIMNKNLWIAIYPGAQHTTIAFTSRIWTALQTLIPADGDYGLPYSTPDQSTSAANAQQKCCVCFVFMILTVLCKL